MESQTARAVVMMEPSLYKRLKEAAIKDRCSAGRIVRLAIETYLAAPRPAR